MDHVNLADLMTDTAPATAEAVSTEATTEQTSQARDEQGRFAPTQQTDEGARAAVEGGSAATTEQPSGTVPQQALHEARQQQKAERERADRLERELAELRGTVNALKPQDKPKEEPKKAFWEDPDGFFSERATPIQQEVVKRHMMTSRMLAEDKFGPETVKAADDALGAVMQANPNDPSVIALAQKIKDSAHPFRDMIEWHREHQARIEIGNDPGAYKARLRAEFMAEFGITSEADAAAVAATTTDATTPSTTTNAQPLTRLPKSLTKLPGRGNAAADGDMSDESVFAHAIGR